MYFSIIWSNRIKCNRWSKLNVRRRLWFKSLTSTGRSLWRTRQFLRVAAVAFQKYADKFLQKWYGLYFCLCSALHWSASDLWTERVGRDSMADGHCVRELWPDDVCPEELKRPDALWPISVDCCAHRKPPNENFKGFNNLIRLNCGSISDIFAYHDTRPEEIVEIKFVKFVFFSFI